MELPNHAPTFTPETTKKVNIMKKKRSVLFDNEIRLLMHKLLPRKRKGVELLLQNPIVFSSQTGIPTPLEYLRTHFDDYDYFTYRQIMEIINWADNILVDKRHLGSYNRLPNPNTRLEAKIYPNSEKLQKNYEKICKKRNFIPKFAQRTKTIRQ